MGNSILMHRKTNRNVTKSWMQNNALLIITCTTGEKCQNMPFIKPMLKFQSMKKISSALILYHINS